MSNFHQENVQALIGVHVQALIDVHVQALIGGPDSSMREILVAGMYGIQLN